MDGDAADVAGGDAGGGGDGDCVGGFGVAFAEDADDFAEEDGFAGSWGK